mgnify:FL=1
MATYEVTKRAIIDITYTVSGVESADEAVEAVSFGDYDAESDQIVETLDDFLDVQRAD